MWSRQTWETVSGNSRMGRTPGHLARYLCQSGAEDRTPRASLGSWFRAADRLRERRHLLARAAARRSEMAVRTALGAVAGGIAGLRTAVWNRARVANSASRSEYGSQAERPRLVRSNVGIDSQRPCRSGTGSGHRPPDWSGAFHSELRQPPAGQPRLRSGRPDHFPGFPAHGKVSA